MSISPERVKLITSLPIKQCPDAEYSKLPTPVGLRVTEVAATSAANVPTA